MEILAKAHHQRPGRRVRTKSHSVDAGKRTYRSLRNTLSLQRSFSDDEIAHIHETALQVLKRLGMRVLNDEARHHFASAGALVDPASLMVFIDRALVEQALASAPGEFMLGGAHSERDVRIGGDATAFMCVGGPPNISDTDRGKRPGTLEDFQNLVRLSQHFEVLHIQGSGVEPQDIPIELRHLAQLETQLTLSDKPVFAYARGAGQVNDVFEMVRLGRGLDAAAFAAKPCCYTVINTNSPRQLDNVMCQGIIDFARAGQLAVITPFTLAGAMAPITVAGALTLQHAEALAGIVLAQLVKPGAPVVYGSFTSNVDMRSGSPAFGTPEFVRAAFGAGQLARHIGLPWRGSGATASNAPDAQAAYEFLNSAWAGLLGGVNMMIHAAGWLESGLTASLEKFVLDVEMLQVLAEVLQDNHHDMDGLFEAIAEVEPGGHFFGSQHTMARYEKAFYTPLVSDWRNFGAWSEDGSRTATERANTIWKKVLEHFEPPPLDVARRDAIAAFREKRTREGGAPIPA